MFPGLVLVRVGFLGALVVEDGDEAIAAIVERLADLAQAGGVAAEEGVIELVEILVDRRALLQIGDDLLVEGAGGLRDGLVELLGGNFSLGDQGRHQLGVLDAGIVGRARLLVTQERILLALETDRQRQAPDGQRDRLQRVQEVINAHPPFEVAVVDLGETGVPECQLKAMKQEEAVAQAGEAVKLGQGLDDPGGHLEVLGLLLEKVSPEVEDPVPLRRLGLALPVALERVVLGPSRLAERVVFGLVGEVSPRRAVRRDRDEQQIQVNDRRGGHGRALSLSWTWRRGTGTADGPGTSPS